MSDIRAGTISDAAGTGPITLTGQSAAKAWVNFNGSGTVAIRDSLNVGSITDSGTGEYFVNFFNNFSNVNYSATVGSGAGGVTYYPPSNYNSSSLKQVTRASDGTVYDSTIISLNAHGDLA